MRVTYEIHKKYCRNDAKKYRFVCFTFRLHRTSSCNREKSIDLTANLKLQSLTEQKNWILCVFLCLALLSLGTEGLELCVVGFDSIQIAARLLSLSVCTCMYHEKLVEHTRIHSAESQTHIENAEQKNVITNSASNCKRCMFLFWVLSSASAVHTHAYESVFDTLTYTIAWLATNQNKHPYDETIYCTWAASATAAAAVAALLMCVFGGSWNLARLAPKLSYMKPKTFSVSTNNSEKSEFLLNRTQAHFGQCTCMCFDVDILFVIWDYVASSSLPPSPTMRSESASIERY